MGVTLLQTFSEKQVMRPCTELTDSEYVPMVGFFKNRNDSYGFVKYGISEPAEQQSTSHQNL
jgi:hypothetical protein